MFKISEVVEGWRNDLFPPEKIKEIIQKVSKERLSICKRCLAYNEKGYGLGPFCNPKVEVLPGVFGCSCPLNKKTKCLTCECPAKKWVAVVTEEEEEKFKLDDNG